MSAVVVAMAIINIAVGLWNVRNARENRAQAKRNLELSRAFRRMLAQARCGTCAPRAGDELRDELVAAGGVQ